MGESREDQEGEKEETPELEKDEVDPPGLGETALATVVDARRVRLKLGDEPLQRRKPLSRRALAALPAPPVATLVEKASANSHFVERPMEPPPATGRGMHILQFVRPTITKTVEPPAEEAETGDAEWQGWDENSDKQQWNSKDWSQWPEPSTSYPSGKTHDGYSSQHGSYRHYYGYRRNGGGAASQLGELDSRLQSVAQRLGKRCFEGMKVLDIGCNSGEISLAVARNLGARRVVGCDIDSKLVEDAISNRDNFVKSCSSDQDAGEALESTKHVPKKGKAGGTCSVTFKTLDFLEAPEEKEGSDKQDLYDAILCFSVTKWIHFAHGDRGIRKLFRRVFRKLTPGGLFVLEPQEWRSYKKKRHLTHQIRQTVAGIQMKPEMFDSFLKELGFEAVAVIEPAEGSVEGFKRYIRVYKKPDEAEEEVEQEPEEVLHEPKPEKRKRKETQAAVAKADKADKKSGKKVDTQEVEDKPAPKRKKVEAGATAAAAAAEAEAEEDDGGEPERAIKPKKKRSGTETGPEKKAQKGKTAKKADDHEVKEAKQVKEAAEEEPPPKRKKGSKKQKASHNA